MELMSRNKVWFLIPCFHKLAKAPSELSKEDVHRCNKYEKTLDDINKNASPNRHETPLHAHWDSYNHHKDDNNPR